MISAVLRFTPALLTILRMSLRKAAPEGLPLLLFGLFCAAGYAGAGEPLPVPGAVSPPGSVAPPSSVAAGALSEAAAGAPAHRAGEDLSAHEEAELIVDGTRIFIFRSSIGPISALERRDTSLGRIRDLLSDGWTGEISSQPIREGILLMAGHHGVFVIMPGDVDESAGDTHDQLVARTASLLTRTLEEGRKARRPATLVRGGILSGVATAVLLIGLALIGRLSRWVRRALSARPETGIHTLSVGGFTIVTVERLLDALRGSIRFLTWAFGVVLSYLWLTFVMDQFFLTRPWGRAIGSWFLTTIGSLALTVLGAIPGLIVVLVIILATRALVRLVGQFFSAVEEGRVEVPWLPPESAKPVRPMVTALLWVFAVVVCYPYVPGSGSDVFKGVSVFAGLVLSLGSTGIMGQAMSGLVLMFARALKPGDYVLVNGIEGTVVAVGQLSTKIRTPKDEEVTIPNNVMVSNAVTNYSRLAETGGFILNTSITIGYDAPWRQIHAMLLEAARKTPGLKREPPPFVRQRALADFYVQYEINAHVENPQQRITVLSTLYANIQDTFNENGVQIMSPHFVGQPARAVIVPRENWHTPPSVDE
jgi:small-conductance mechanosensitive channel